MDFEDSWLNSMEYWSESFEEFWIAALIHLSHSRISASGNEPKQVYCTDWEWG